MGSPLIVATDVRNMTEVMYEALLNTEILAVNQENQTPAGDRLKTEDCDKNVTNACQVFSPKM